MSCGCLLHQIERIYLCSSNDYQMGIWVGEVDLMLDLQGMVKLSHANVLDFLAENQEHLPLFSMY